MIEEENITEEKPEVKQEAQAEPQKTKLTPEQVKKNIQAGERWLKSGHYKGQDARWKQWEKNKEYLMCLWSDSEEDTVNVNTIYSNYRIVRPTLYFKNPRISVKPLKPQFQKDAQGNKAINPETGKPILIDNYRLSKLFAIKINHELKELNFKKQAKKVLGDVLCPYGVGWLKWGYDKITTAETSNNRETGQQIWCRRVDPRNLVYDWMATDIDDARFTAERLVLTRAEAKANGITIPEGYICSLPDFLKDREDAAKAGDDGDDLSLVIVWEYHDLVNNVLYWQLESSSDTPYPDFAKEPEVKPYPFEGSSYVPMILNDDNDDIVGLSDVEPIEDQAKAINRIRTKQTRHVDNYGTHTFYEETAIEEHELNNTKRNTHGLQTKVKDGGLNRMRTEPTPQMGRDNYEMDMVHKNDMRQTIGVTDYEKGGADSRTATEAQIIQNSANVRITERRDVIYDFVIECVRRLAALIQEFATEEDFINVSGEQFDEDFVTYLKDDLGYNPKIPFLGVTKEQLQGEWDFDFKVEDMITRPKEVQLQQMIQMVTALSNPLMMEAAKQEDISMGKVLQKLFELSDIDINELKHGGPVQIPAVKENLMFQDGKEVPEPHQKDNDDEHNLIHLPVAKKLEMSLQEALQQKNQIMMMVQSGEAQPEVAMKAQETMGQLDQQIMLIEKRVSKIKIHMQAHEEKSAIKQQSKLRSSTMQAAQALPQQGPSKQVAMKAQVA